MSSDERTKILKMVADGILSIEEAEKLLDVIDDAQPSEQQHTASEGDWNITGKKGKWLRVVVSDTNTGHKKVNLRLPSGLISAGLKIGSRFAPEIEEINAQEIIDALSQNVQGKFIDVFDDEDGEHVEIYVE